MNKKKDGRVCSFNKTTLLALNFFMGVCRGGVNRHCVYLRVLRLALGGYVELYKEASPSPVTYNVYENWNTSLCLSFSFIMCIVKYFRGSVYN